MVLCCAAPALIAAGVLTGIGGLLRNPWVIGAGIAVLTIAIFGLLRRRRTRTADCCDPPTHTRADDETSDENYR